MIEDVSFIIIEDQPKPIDRWLNVLQDYKVQGADVLLNAVPNFIDFLDHSGRSYSTIPEPEFVLGCPGAMLLRHQDGVSFRTMGVRAGNVIIFTVRDDRCIEHLQLWLGQNIPKRCLSFLDYGLAGRNDADLAAKIAPHLAVSHSQLCVGSSSIKQDISYPKYLGLDSVKSCFFRELSKSLLVADDAVAEAFEFWSSHNTKFTGDSNIDRVIALFVRGYQKAWDMGDGLDGPFGHDSLQAQEQSSSQTEIAALMPGLMTADKDSIKALFMCGQEVTRVMQTKEVTLEVLQAVIKFLDINSLIDLGCTGYWLPPFHPGILFLAQIKLLANEFSDTKGGKRKSPQLLIQRDAVEFRFIGVDIAASRLGNYRNECKSSGTKSCCQLMAIEDGFLDESTRREKWLKYTAASHLRKLFHPSDESKVCWSIQVVFNDEDCECLRIKWLVGKKLRDHLNTSSNHVSKGD